jgi:hypothetical protein
MLRRSWLNVANVVIMAVLLLLLLLLCVLVLLPLLVLVLRCAAVCCHCWCTTQVYTEVCEGGHYDSGACWGDIQGLLGKHGSICKENAADGQGFESSISTSDGTSPVVEAVLHLSFV